MNDGPPLKISVFGLGYVGAVTAACLARHGHSVVGVDVHPQKIEAFNRGEAPIIEPGLDELLQQAKAQGRLRATDSCADALADTEVSIVCVGTPSTVTGALDLGYVRGVTREIGEVLRRQGRPHALVFRSTMLPGSTAWLVEEFLADRVKAGTLQVFYYPEFLREGTAVEDFEEPALAVVGAAESSPPPPALAAALFGPKAVVVNWPTAELVKYACNAFHAAKITFANEIGRLAQRAQIDAQTVMRLVCQDTKLNLSACYLRPGNPFGGSCLPKDVRALTQQGRQQGLELPLLESLLPSNEQHLQSLLARIHDAGQDEVVILGLSFKPGTDDLRESAMVEVAQTLLGRGYTVRIFDPSLNLAALVGRNKREVETRIPRLASLLSSDLGAALGARGLVVAAQRCVAIEQLANFITPQHRLLDVNGWPDLKTLPTKYEGFCW